MIFSNVLSNILNKMTDLVFNYLTTHIQPLDATKERILAKNMDS